jgi:hypothetical protein
MTENILLLMKNIDELCKDYAHQKGFLGKAMDSKKLKEEIASYEATEGFGRFLKFLSYLFSGGIEQKKRMLIYCN